MDNVVKSEKKPCNGEGTPCNFCTLCREDAKNSRKEQRQNRARYVEQGRKEASKAARRGGRKNYDY